MTDQLLKAGTLAKDPRPLSAFGDLKTEQPQALVNRGALLAQAGRYRAYEPCAKASLNADVYM
jgi:hypothetical protein